MRAEGKQRLFLRVVLGNGCDLVVQAILACSLLLLLGGTGLLRRIELKAQLLGSREHLAILLELVVGDGDLFASILEDPHDITQKSDPRQVLCNVLWNSLRVQHHQASHGEGATDPGTIMAHDISSFIALQKVASSKAEQFSTPLQGQGLAGLIGHPQAAFLRSPQGDTSLERCREQIRLSLGQVSEVCVGALHMHPLGALS